MKTSRGDGDEGREMPKWEAKTKEGKKKKKRKKGWGKQQNGLTTHEASTNGERVKDWSRQQGTVKKERDVRAKESGESCSYQHAFTCLIEVDSISTNKGTFLDPTQE